MERRTSPLAVERQGRGRTAVCIRPQVELGAHAGRRWIERNVEIHGIHLPLRGPIIGKTDRTSFFSAHGPMFP